MRDKALRRQAKRMMAQPWQPFKEVDLETTKPNPPGMTRAFKNNRYAVMIYDNAMTTFGPAIKACIHRHDDTPIHDRKRIQMIKNEVFGKEATAIEYYPAESQQRPSLGNVTWLWIFPPDIIPLPLEGRFVSEDIDHGHTIDIMQENINKLANNATAAREKLAEQMKKDGLEPGVWGIKENMVLSEDGLTLTYVCEPVRMEETVGE